MLTIQFVPYHEIEKLSSAKRVKKLLELAKQDKIILLEGRLKREEETDLIKKTMEEISPRFKGIELAVLYPEKEDDALLKKAKKEMINLLLGDRQGITILGPATILKEIKKDPNKIELLTRESRRLIKKKRNNNRNKRR